MTALAGLIKRQIAASGPMTVADYVAMCLTHPQHGYYVTRDPLGAAGDFTTAPEISQMFGELIGLSLAQAWLDQGAPSAIALVELGPGRGTLMADALRATAGVPGFGEAARVHLVEASPVLRARQSETIGHTVHHHDTLATVPEGPLFLIANEFFDALPARQFIRSGNGWRERMVGLSGDDLAFGLSDPFGSDTLAGRMADTDDGDLIEVSSIGAALAADIGARIAAHGGAALIIDYGDWRSLGDTLQAVQTHERADPLSDPGASDLTFHVDFEALALAAAPARYTRLTPQGVFLERLGLAQRAQSLAERLTGHSLESHIAAHRRLAHPDEMGTLFKVLGVYPDGAPPPPGLEA